MMTIGSLFSGIGGLELGLENTGLGQTVWQVEINGRLHAVLAEHWPNARRCTDVRAVGKHNLDLVDIICGGFPCQDVSSAGNRAGLSGARSGLWAEFARVVKELEPGWVVVENVASGAKLWVDRVRSDLGGLGYETLPIPVRADALGAPYRRARIFLVGWRVSSIDRNGQHYGTVDAKMGSPSQADHIPTNRGAPASTKRVQLRLEPWWRSRSDGEGPPLAALDRWCGPMPPVGRVVSGPADVLARTAGGNCVVPAQAEVAGWVIRELLDRDKSPSHPNGLQPD